MDNEHRKSPQDFLSGLYAIERSKAQLAVIFNEVDDALLDDAFGWVNTVLDEVDFDKLIDNACRIGFLSISYIYREELSSRPRHYARVREWLIAHSPSDGDAESKAQADREMVESLLGGLE